MRLNGLILPRAYNCTRREIHYRHDCFSEGLRAAGYEVRSNVPQETKPGDVLLIWNRYDQMHEIATRFEKAGGTVLVAENGYLGADETGHQLYALARHAHNGRGQWYVGGPERWNALGIELKPWRTDGNHILICPNRSFGMPGLAMPPDWGNTVRRRLAKLTKREVRLRPHPGNDAPRRPLLDDLAGAWAVVIWASSAGVNSLIVGVPVLCESPAWICKAASGSLNEVEAPPMPDRLPAMHGLAFAQWSLKEIKSGEAFEKLLTTCPEMA